MQRPNVRAAAEGLQTQGSGGRLNPKKIGNSENKPEPIPGQLIDRYGHPHSEGVLTAWSPAMLRIMGVHRVGGA